MISKLESFGVGLSHINDLTTTKKDGMIEAHVRSQSASDKVVKLKMAVESGEYKINLSALANKMADSLL